MKHFVYLIFMSNKTIDLQELIQSLLNLILFKPEYQQYILIIECN